MEEAVVKGTITGFASVAYSAARFEVDADLAVAGLGAGDVELDSVKVVAKIEDEQLNGSLLIRDQGYVEDSKVVAVATKRMLERQAMHEGVVADPFHRALENGHLLEVRNRAHRAQAVLGDVDQGDVAARPRALDGAVPFPPSFDHRSASAAASFP